MILIKCYSGFKKSEGYLVLAKIKNKGKVATQFLRRAPSPFLFGWQSLLEVGVFSSQVMHSPISESAHRNFSHPNKKAVCGRDGSIRTTRLKKRK